MAIRAKSEPSLGNPLYLCQKHPPASLRRDNQRSEST